MAWIRPPKATAEMAPREPRDSGRIVMPPVVGDHIGEAVRAGDPVLLTEPNEGVVTSFVHRDADVVGTARYGRGLPPGPRAGVEHMVVGPGDLAFGVAADHVQPVVLRGRPGHLASRDGQGLGLAPVSGRLRLGRRRIEEPLGEGVGRQLGDVRVPELA